MVYSSYTIPEYTHKEINRTTYSFYLSTIQKSHGTSLGAWMENVYAK